MERRNAWKDYDKKELKELENLSKDYRKFLDNGKTERECVKYIIKMAKEAGYEVTGSFSSFARGRLPIKMSSCSPSTTLFAFFSICSPAR